MSSNFGCKLVPSAYCLFRLFLILDKEIFVDYKKKSKETRSAGDEFDFGCTDCYTGINHTWSPEKSRFVFHFSKVTWPCNVFFFSSCGIFPKCAKRYKENCPNLTLSQTLTQRGAIHRGGGAIFRSRCKNTPFSAILSPGEENLWTYLKFISFSDKYLKRINIRGDFFSRILIFANQPF